LGSNVWFTHIGLGSFFYRQGRHEEAAREFERTRDLAPENAVVYFNLAAVYYHLNREDEAASALQRGLEIRPTAGAFNNLATIYFYQGKYAESVKVFEKALSAGANSYLHWGNYGDACRWSVSDKSKAGDAYKRAVELAQAELRKAPEDLEIRSRIAIYLVKSGRGADASREAEAVEAKQPRTGSIRFKLAQVREILGDRNKALEHLAAAIEARYSRKEIERDPEFVALRRDPEYHRLLLAATK
jgi:serine/threonine-protein kinase